MALKPCRECGAQVSTAAGVCPHCGVGSPTVTKSQIRWDAFGETILSIVRWTIVLGVCVAIFMAKSGPRSASGTGASARPDWADWDTLS